MLDFTWKMFSRTGNINMYLLYKELEREMEGTPKDREEKLADEKETMTQ
jgi:hypothetical protein